MQIIETNLKTNGSFARRNATTAVILHHAEASNASVETINQWHLNNGWVGIGYHYYIRKDGSIYRGRPEWAIGSHALNHNSYSISICAEGSYNTETMPKAQLEAIKWLIRDIMRRKGKLKLLRHKDVNSTDCPGKNYPWEAVQQYEQEEDMTETQTRQIAKEEIANAQKVYKTMNDIPLWGKETAQKLIDKNILKGDGNGLNLTEEMLRVLVMNDRAGLYC